TNELLSYVEDEDPEVLGRIFERRRRRRVEGALARLHGLPFPDKVAELARILDADGYLADFEALPDGTFRITEHNCAILGEARGSCHPVRSPSTARTPRSGATTNLVQPSAGRTVPASSATVSNARTTVVPTATIRPPASRAWATRRAVCSGTR